MKVTVLCTNRAHPVVSWLKQWQEDMTARGHEVSLCHDKAQLDHGDLLFLVSCGQIVGETDRRRFGLVIVIHASDLPKGRGWSPHVWSILNGEQDITVCALEARDPVDTGDIWLKGKISLAGHELLPEINRKLFEVELSLMTRLVEDRDHIRPEPQAGEPGPCLPKRTPEHSRLDPRRSLTDQFDLLRVVDNDRYPAFFDYKGHRYVLRIDKATNED